MHFVDQMYWLEDLLENSSILKLDVISLKFQRT